MPERFYKLLAEVAARPELTGNDKILLSIISNHIGGNGYCWPGVKTLAKETGTDHTTVLRSIGHLEAAGALQVERRGKGKVNHYRLTSREMQPVAKHDQSRNTTSASRETQPQVVAKCESRRKTKARTKGARRKAPAPDPRVKRFIDWFAAEYLRAQGRAYILAGAKDGGLVKTLLGRLEGNGHDPLALLQQATKRMMMDEWGGSRASIGVLASQINLWLTPGGRRGRRRGQFLPTDPNAADLRPDDDYSGTGGSA